MNNKKQEVRTIKIDPKMFISKPFIDCPKCKQKNCFGVLLIGNNRYTRRCRECRFDQSYSLPSLDKKIIYIDQFLISNIAKALNKNLGKGKKIADWYIKLFASLDRLSKLQQIVCPDSEFHRQESLLFSYKVLKRMHEHLSNGVSIYDRATISRFQIAVDFKSHIKSKDKNDPITIDDLLMDDRNSWHDRLLVTIDWRVDPKEIETYQVYRKQITKNSQQFYDYWKQKRDMSFKELFRLVASEFGRNTIQNYVNLIAKYAAASLGQYQPSQSDLLSFGMSEESVLISNLLHYLPEDIKYEEKIRIVSTYLQSERLFQIPFNEIQSAIWSAIEYQIITGGRRSPPNTGMINDVEMVSSYMPYVDAIFVDNDIRNLLQFGEVKKIISKYKAKIFSPSNKEEFFDYLKKIEDDVSKNIKEKVLEVYGEEFIKPFYEMYDY